MTQDRKDLKIQALLESLSKDKVKHESEMGDLRVELTLVSQERDQLREELETLRREQPVVGSGEVVPGELVSEEAGPEDSSD